jgi:hypothetical protein
VRHLWLITATMIALGALMVLGSQAVGIGPVLLVGGLLLIWSALVKVIVLRVWRVTLGSPPLPEPRRDGARAGSALGPST